MIMVRVHREVLLEGRTSGRCPADEHASTLHGARSTGQQVDDRMRKSPLTMTHTCAHGQASCSIAGPT